MSTRLIEDVGTGKVLVTFEFSATDVPDAAGNAVAQGAAGAEYLLPFAGSVIAITAASNAAFTSGTLTLQPTVNGAANTALQTVLSSTAQRSYKAGEAGRVSFQAGQRLGVSWTKTGTVAPVTNDLVITLWVLVEGVDY